MLDIENKFNKLYFNDDIIKINEKLPKRIKNCIEKGKEINKEWNENELSNLINDCINIENIISDINEIKCKIEKSNFNLEKKILFKPEEEGINNIINTINNFGEIYLENYKKYAIRKYPLNAKEDVKYNISGDKNNIMTKTGTDYKWMRLICINELDESIEEHIWKIKILKSSK